MKFRFKALQRMREPDELDSPTLLAAPRGWIALFVVMITMGAALLWVFVGRIPISVDAPGLLTRHGGTALVQSPYAGMVQEVLAQPADTVTQGQALARVEDDSGHVRVVSAPFAGQVVGVPVGDGEVVQPGSTVAAIERTDVGGSSADGSATGSGGDVVAMVFVPAARAIGLAPGEPVDLSVSTAPAGAFGLLRGTIESVSPYPLTREAVSGLVGGDLAAGAYAGSSPPRLVVVDLLPDPHTPTGFAWTSASGPPGRLTTQVSVTATIDLGHQTPFDMFLGR
ncbi:HlyD family efflux transporter periplasmic adaptor subunit [Streptacidiphilus rugosus]|uniref:HlyD family efflux transporter periplasmic adaptor subunit n=1 Tax=Streptacidiphilus rugosus TaxID=405783 RepID=UPI00055EE35D|nr:HlyD family efflux transporter periplasmic adaptor subunit [Streptacidiphilus rugosus]